MFSKSISLNSQFVSRVVLRPLCNLESQPIRSSIITSKRSFSSTPVSQFPPKSKKEIDAQKAKDKKIQRKEQQRKLKAKRPANASPLFMEIPNALKYLRAAEIGRPINEAVLSVQTTVLSERGVAPLQGAVRFPRALKETKICVLSLDEVKRQEALDAGATEVGGAEFIDKILNGEANLDFDKIIATTDIEAQLRRVARVLGPKGLMPSAKRGTVSNDISELISGTLGTQPFREKNGFVALTVARCDFSDEEVIKNIIATSKAVKDSVSSIKTKKPIILGQTILTTTHGPGIVINF
ncbi:unnamed protein product [[Candida] boidinii]|uniref:Unnamed protein product n=1 Tax=Candida boidinii TaxID=5477 RepID=A0ACB5TIK9_CANBO|nr:unnamed protein product [[Candida] boidinii]